jgi:hypothetical protein
MASLSNFRRWASVVGMEMPLAAALVGLDVVARLLPHAPNFTPIAASALFAGMLFRDLVTGTYDWRVMAVVYAALTLPALLGMWGSRFRAPIVLAPVVLSSSLLFFVTTNFAVWAFSGMYPADLDGLIRCYVAALPFLQNTVTGDMVWTTALFGAWWLASGPIPKFVSTRRTFRYELRNLRTTSNL